MTPEINNGKIILIPTTFHEDKDFESMLRYTNIERKYSFPCPKTTINRNSLSLSQSSFSNQDTFWFEVNITDLVNEEESETISKIEQSIEDIADTLNKVKISKIGLLEYGHIDGYKLCTLLYKVNTF